MESSIFLLALASKAQTAASEEVKYFVTSVGFKAQFLVSHRSVSHNNSSRNRFQSMKWKNTEFCIAQFRLQKTVSYQEGTAHGVSKWKTGMGHPLDDLSSKNQDLTRHNIHPRKVRLPVLVRCNSLSLRGRGSHFLRVRATPRPTMAPTARAAPPPSTAKPMTPSAKRNEGGSCLKRGTAGVGEK